VVEGKQGKEGGRNGEFIKRALKDRIKRGKKKGVRRRNNGG